MIRRNNEPEPPMSMLEAADILRRISNAYENDDHLQIFTLLGIDEQITANIQNTTELYEIVAVRINNLAKIAKLDTQP